MLGTPLQLATVVSLLIVASLGLGLLISIVSDSERQAVQLSLLVLLASVFFSGFVLPISEFSTPVRVAANLIPVTTGIVLMQDVMLRGEIVQQWQAAAPGGDRDRPPARLLAAPPAGHVARLIALGGPSGLRPRGLADSSRLRNGCPGSCTRGGTGRA